MWLILMRWLSQLGSIVGFGSGGRELLGHHLGMFKDKLDIGVDDSRAASDQAAVNYSAATLGCLRTSSTSVSTTAWRRC